MATYTYIARDRNRQVSRGKLVANSPFELRSRLNAAEMQLISYDNASVAVRLDLLQVVNPKHWLPTRSRDVELALHQLAMMLRSGLRLLDAIKALQLQAERRSMSRLLEDIHDSIGKGQSLSNALAPHAVIPPIVVQLVNVGEQTGNLDSALEQSKDYLAQRRTVITEVRVAVSYPAIVTVAALAVAAYLVLVVIPQLQTFLAALGRDLPAMTQSLIEISRWIRFNGVALVFCVGLSTAGLSLMLYWERGKLILDRYLLRLPIVGSVLRLSGTAGVASSLAIMTKSGIRLVPALDISTNMQRNSYLADLLHKASYSVSRGNPLAPSLAHGEGFTPILASMVEVAESAGHLDTTLIEVAKLCDAELKTKIKRLSQMIEPVVILVAGGIVGYVYIAFFIALMSAGGGVK